MQKVIFLQNYKNYKRKEIKDLSNNVVHGLLELGIVQRYNESIKKEIKNPPMDKIMRSEINSQKEKGRYEIK